MKTKSASLSSIGHSRKGQAFLEFLIVTPLILGLIGGGALLLKRQWGRTRCAFETFQAAHHALHSGASFNRLTSGLGSLRIEETPAGVRAEATCGAAHEVVQLPWLESAQW